MATKTTKKATKKTSLSFVSRAYSIDYMVKNPPASAKGLKLVWQTAVLEYMKRQGVDLTDKKNYQKPIQNISFSDITRIFNSLIGKRNPPKSSKKAG